jgi:pimeloyl-ACP methyl ester carboxylesterase
VGNWKTYEGSWVAALNAAGFSVAGIDNRGCGRSSGLLGYVVGVYMCERAGMCKYPLTCCSGLLGYVVGVQTVCRYKDV